MFTACHVAPSSMRSRPTGPHGISASPAPRAMLSCTESHHPALWRHPRPLSITTALAPWLQKTDSPTRVSSGSRGSSSPDPGPVPPRTPLPAAPGPPPVQAVYSPSPSASRPSRISPSKATARLISQVPGPPSSLSCAQECTRLVITGHAAHQLARLVLGPFRAICIQRAGDARFVLSAPGPWPRQALVRPLPRPLLASRPNSSQQCPPCCVQSTACLSPPHMAGQVCAGVPTLQPGQQLRTAEKPAEDRAPKQGQGRAPGPACLLRSPRVLTPNCTASLSSNSWTSY